MKLFLALALILAANPAHAALRGAPYQPEIDQRFSDLEEDQAEGQAIARKYAKAVYDVSLDGGSSTANKSLGVYLPAGAVITGIYLYTNTAFTAAGGGAGVNSLAFQCSGTRDLVGYQKATALNADSLLARVASATAFDWASAAAVMGPSKDNAEVQVPSVPSACQITAVVRGDSGYEAYTAGKATLIVEYFSRQ